jgi:hypothetical protein
MKSAEFLTIFLLFVSAIRAYPNSPEEYEEFLNASVELNGTPYDSTRDEPTAEELFTNLNDSVVLKKAKEIASKAAKKDLSAKEILDLLTINILKEGIQNPALAYGLTQREMTLTSANKLIALEGTLKGRNDPYLVDSYTNVVPIVVSNPFFSSYGGSSFQYKLMAQTVRDTDVVLAGVHFFEKSSPGSVFIEEFYKNSGWQNNEVSLLAIETSMKFLAIICRETSLEEPYFVAVEILLVSDSANMPFYLLKECQPRFRDDFHITFYENTDRTHKKSLKSHELFNSTAFFQKKEINDEEAAKVSGTFFKIDLWIERGDLPIEILHVFVDDKRLSSENENKHSHFVAKEPEVEAVLTKGLDHNPSVLIGQNSFTAKNLTLEGAINCNTIAQNQGYEGK